MKRIVRHNQKGFTIIELMIALVVFTILMMMCIYGVIYIGRMFYKGVTVAKTQNVARVTTDDIVRSLQFNNASNTGFLAANPATGEPGRLCMQGVAYRFVLQRQFITGPDIDPDTQSAYGLQRLILNGSSACPDVTDPIWQDASEMLAERMRLTEFSVTSTAAGEPAGWKVKMGVLYGDNDVLADIDGNFDGSAGPLVRCRGSAVGTEFCAVSNLDVMVAKRL